MSLGRLLTDCHAEFRIFVETTEKQLLQLFRSIDTDQDGRVEKAELQNAFKKAGITVPTRKLTEFFNEIDLNNDGYISFDEWRCVLRTSLLPSPKHQTNPVFRDFLLFMPIHHGSSPLQGALSYYSRIVTLTSEGDSLVSEDTLEGLGTTGDLIQFLFGTLIMLAKPSIQRPLYPPPSTARPDTLEGGPGTYSEDSASLYDASAEDAAEAARIQMELDWEKEMQDGAFWLTQFMPAPGYFLAGAIAGGVSRTATAPLDRLKVYLLVNTKAALNPVEVVKKGQVLGALRHVGRPVADAVKDLWRAGGFRTFFAGEL